MKPSSGRAPRVATHVATLAAALAGLALTLGFAPAVHAAPPPTADLTPQADAAIAQHDWASALTELDARIKANPRDVQAKFKRATVLARIGRDDDAIEAFSELTQLYPELPEPYNNLAALYAKHGRYDEARAALETAVKANPSYSLGYENLGDLYLRLADASYRRANALGHASPVTEQRLADLQKIIAPATPPVARKKAPVDTSTEERTNPAASGLVTNPNFQFGGTNGSLGSPPYIAPSN